MLPFHPPKQARSLQTLENIMDATESLLESAAFDRITVQQITERAGCAAGSFYTRFADKNAVLEALFLRYLRDTEASTGNLERSLTGETSLARRARAIVELMVHVFRARRGVSRAAQLHYLTRPESATDELRSRLGAMYERLTGALHGDGSEIRHPDSHWAARFAIQVVAATCRTKILFTDHPVPDTTGSDDDRLVAELSDLVIRYLAPATSTRPLEE